MSTVYFSICLYCLQFVSSVYYSYIFLSVVRTLTIYSLSKFQGHSMVLTLVTTLYIRSPELIHLVTEHL